jgi:hypothetical protein
LVCAHMHACCANISVFVNAEILKSWLFMELVYISLSLSIYIYIYNV